MYNLIELMQSQLSPQTVEQVDKQIGAGSKEQTAVAMQSVISTLVSAMAKNAQKPDGAHSLASALERDHDGSILNDMMGFLGGQKEASNPKMVNGAGILSHVLGNKQDKVAKSISKESGLDQQKVMNLLITLAPIVMGFLGKAKKDGDLNPQSLGNLLKTASVLLGGGKNSSSQGDLLGSLLGGGQKSKPNKSFMENIAESGMKSILGKLFKK